MAQNLPSRGNQDGISKSNTAKEHPQNKGHQKKLSQLITNISTTLPKWKQTSKLKVLDK